MENLSGVMREIRERHRRMFANYPDNPEPRYDCSWCHDSGYVTCYVEDRKNYPIKFAEVLHFQRENKNCITMGACVFCEAGTYKGRPTAGGLKAAERWVRENVTTVVSLKGTYEKAAKEGYGKDMVDEAFKRVGIVKEKSGGRWFCEPAA
jgi:hypothetical protein